MKLRRETKEAIKNDELLKLLFSVYAQLDSELLLHAIRCGAHLYAANNGITPRTVYDGLFKDEQTTEEWEAWLETIGQRPVG